MFSMNATAPNSTRKNQRQQIRRANRASSPGIGSVGSGENINGRSGGNSSFVSLTKANHLTRSKNNISPTTQQPSSGERIIAQNQDVSPPLLPIQSRRFPTDINTQKASTNNSLDVRDEESNGQRNSAHISGNAQINNDDSFKNENAQHDESYTKIDTSDDSPSSGASIQRNDSISANIDDMNLLPNNNHPRLHLSPKQERCSSEMKKNILSLLEKSTHHELHKQEDSNIDVATTDVKLESKSLSDANSTSHQRDPAVCRKRLETEESRTSTLSVNDLLNLQQGCALSSTSSCTHDGTSNIDPMNEVKLNKNDFRRSGSMEPMVEGAEEEDKGEASITQDSERTLPKPTSPLIYRLYNDSPTSPMSEVNSVLLGATSAATTSAAAFQESPCSSAGIAPSLFQENADDDIGGDTYFEEKLSPRLLSQLTDVAGGEVDDFVTPLPPPRVNRTKNNPMECSSISSTDPTTSTAADSSNVMTTSIVDLAGAPMLPLHSPRRQTLHTHSLLDDCSDEEENDDDEDEELSSSYVMIDAQNSSRGITNWKKRSDKQNKSPGNMSISQQMASNNIQIALLQTRHRRWEIQSALCGSHAQSNQVFDLSTRVHLIPKFHNRQQQHFSFSPIRTSTTSDANIDDDDVAFLARLSVSIESIRAGALGSGLWRTVRLVKLPPGLFGWHWLMWKEQRQVPDSVYFGDGMPLDNEVWSLLQMLGETFPNLEQVDFGGDIAKSPAAASSEDQSFDSADTYNKDEWRNEILTCVMQCLPKLVAVDGFAVEMEKGSEDVTPIKSYETQESSADGSFGDVPLNANDEQHFTNPGHVIQAQSGVRTRKVRCRTRTSSFNIPNQCDVATETSDAMEDVSENIMSLCGNYADTDGHSEEKTIAADHYGPMIETYAPEDETKVAASSPLASSFSWGSTGSSGARPPTCPKSDTRRRLPTKPSMKNQMKSKLSKKNKRRLKKLTGLMPSMMDDEEDSDDDESESEGVEDCPSDLL